MLAEEENARENNDKRVENGLKDADVYKFRSGDEEISKEKDLEKVERHGAEHPRAHNSLAEAPQGLRLAQENVGNGDGRDGEDNERGLDGGHGFIISGVYISI